MLPEWAAGFWQCKLRYASQDELLAVAREHKRRGLPLSVIVIDFFHWTSMGEWKFDPACWPDPPAMVRELDEMGVKVMVSIWPTVNPLSENYDEMERRGLLVRGRARHRQSHRSSPIAGRTAAVHLHLLRRHPSRGARVSSGSRVRENYYRYGIKVLWLDDSSRTCGRSITRTCVTTWATGWRWPTSTRCCTSRRFYEGMRAEGETEIVNLCRSAWAGSQRYGAAIWSGDIPSTFEALQPQVRAGLNIGLSGIPWWTTDIGGFFGGDLTRPYFRELIVRWFQYGVFCPLFRLHGLRQPDGRLGCRRRRTRSGRSATRPTRIIKSCSSCASGCGLHHGADALAAEKGTPPMRPLFFDFPDDPACASVDDQFMFGPDLLVAPVLQQGATSRAFICPPK